MAGFVVLALGVSLWLYAQAVWLEEGATATRPPWNQRFEHFREVDRWMDAHHVSDDVAVFVNDPPAFYGVTDRRAIMIPSNGPAVIDDAAARYGARYLLLESQGASPYQEVYRQGALPGWQRVARFEDSDGDDMWLFRREDIDDA